MNVIKFYQNNNNYALSRYFSVQGKWYTLRACASFIHFWVKFFQQNVAPLVEFHISFRLQNFTNYLCTPTNRDL